MPLLEESVPEGCHHYDKRTEVPVQAQKYWQQRYDIFSKYDDGIWMTDESWYGVTPEPVAEVLAQHVAEGASKSKTILIDAFAGVGGNTIAFAKSGRWDRIFAIEQDAKTLECAKHNAKIYGVEKKIWFIQGDCFEVLRQRLKSMGKDAIIFASPPWGGPGYKDDEVFNLSSMQPYSLSKLYEGFSKITPDVILYLPRTSNLNQLASVATNGKHLEVCHYCMRGASKALCAYYGDFSFN